MTERTKMADILDDLLTLARTEDTGERWKGDIAMRARAEIERLRVAVDMEKEAVTERTKIFTVAHLLPSLEREWLQHLRDFDVAHPGCHFEVIVDAPDVPFHKVIDMLRPPALPVQEVWSQGKP